MKPFLRSIEVWVPSADRSHLRLSEGLYGKCSSFAEVSKDTTFAFGEGLPGKVWAEGEPVILKSIENSYFKRLSEAKEAGLAGGIAVPVYAGEYLMAVLVFLFAGGDRMQAGAVEIWASDTPGELALKDGYYGSLDDFAWISKRIRFQRGKGLPGQAWMTRLPVLMGELGNSDSFLRAQDAKRSGLTSGLALPCFCPAQKDYIVTLLSASEFPLAQRFEIWVPAPDRSRLVFTDGCALEGPLLKSAYLKSSLVKGQGAIGRAWELGIPVVLDGVISEPVLASGKTGTHPPSSMLAIPILDMGALSSVVAFYL